MRSVADRVPADFLLSFTFLAALSLLILNDLVLKSQFPGLISGKLSDVAGPVVVALLAVAAVEACIHACGGARWAKPWWFTVAGITVVCVFAVIKMTATGSSAFVNVTSSLMDFARPVSGLLDWEWADDTPEPIRDIWDAAIALLAIPISVAIGHRWRSLHDRSTRPARR